jgi:translation initiation factor IF-2
MNLSSLSSQLNMSVQELRKNASAKGFFISPRANKVDNFLAKKISEALRQPVKKVDDGTPVEPKKIKLPQYIKVRDFAELMQLPVVEVIKHLIKNGIMATINESVDFDTATIIAQDLGFEVEAEVSETQAEFGLNFLQTTIASEKKENITPRPPIVAVMGHVDHGKTTLLDVIRTADVVGSESGGITQHIGAYQIKHNDKLITFLDTPGHEAFVEMRARGANVTDLIVLVVAADDGVRPQTVEVINRAKFTNTPIIVAINKIDKEGANPLRVKQELAEYGLLTEEWGGKTIAVEISAKQKKGIDQLLEMILLSAEVEDFQANPSGKMVGTVIESHLDQGKGPIATAIVQNGTLKVGDIIVAGKAFGRVKNLDDEHGKKLKLATPSSPVQISGFSVAPEVGDILQTMDSLETAKEIATNAQKKERSHRLSTKKGIEGDLKNKALRLIIKADVTGSLEAIKQSLAKLKNDEVTITILNEGVGEVNESDVLMAASSKATVIAFHTKTNPKAINLAKQKQVSVDSYDVIYELLEDVTSAVIKMFTPEMEKVSFGKGKILQIFRTEKGQMIVGGKVDQGEIRKNYPVAIWRGEAELGRGTILDLQQSKVPAKAVDSGNEFGLKVKTTVKIEVGDTIESFEETLKQKTL